MRGSIRYRWLLMLPIMLYVAACSRAELVYENADWLIYRWAAGLVDATGDQRDAWRERFDVLLDEHRQRLLPEVVALVGVAQQEVERGLNEQSLNCLFDRTDTLYRDHAALAIPLAVGILSEITPAQIDHLAEEFDQRNDDYVEDYLDEDLEKRAAARSERYIERVERWTGRLDDQQRQLIADAVDKMPDTAAPWLAYRRAQQQQLLGLLRSRATPDQLREFLTAWWVEIAQRPPVLTARVLEVRQRSIAVVLAVDAALRPEQRNGLTERVADIRSSLGNALLVASTPSLATTQRCS